MIKANLPFVQALRVLDIDNCLALKGYCNKKAKSQNLSLHGFYTQVVKILEGCILAQSMEKQEVKFRDKAA